MILVYVLALGLFLGVKGSSGDDAGIGVSSYYLKENCGTPNRVDSSTNVASCSEGCQAHGTVWKSVSYSCNTSNYEEVVVDKFNGASFLLMEKFEEDCQVFTVSSALLASEICEQVIEYVPDWGFAAYEIIKLEDNGSVSVRYFTDEGCTSPLSEPALLTGSIYVQDTDVTLDLLNSSLCDADGIRWTYYGSTLSSSSSGNRSDTLINADLSSASGNGEASLSSAPSTSDSKAGVIGAVVGGVFAVVLVLLAFVFYRRRRNSKNSSAASDVRTSSLTVDVSAAAGLQGQSGLWGDDIITAKRISRREVHIKGLLSRGAFGEVYEGVFDDKRVAVKMLPPETRGIIHHVNNFLAEAKLTAVMDHPRIISFIGVAWNSLSDLCVVLEFMEGGDLRTLLNEYNASQHPVGIDREKASIALHVCHALTYLHSLSPAVIHRDLKSRNILLSRDLEAKLTDFGISRERPDQTMTAGVGTSLWMAPEVMLGQRYDDKADMFSFGVVLSELDVHTLPYAQSNEQNRDSNGKRLPDAILLQKVAMGKLSVDFSKASPPSITELGRACVAVDPGLRPTAAEALYKLQVVLSEEFE